MLAKIDNKYYFLTETNDNTRMDMINRLLGNNDTPCELCNISICHSCKVAIESVYLHRNTKNYVYEICNRAHRIIYRPYLTDFAQYIMIDGANIASNICTITSNRTIKEYDAKFISIPNLRSIFTMHRYAYVSDYVRFTIINALKGRLAHILLLLQHAFIGDIAHIVFNAYLDIL